MRELIISTVISGLSFLIFLVTLVLGFTRKNKNIKLTALFFFLAFIGLTIWTYFRFVSKIYNKVTETLRPGTGDEIYEALFDKRQTDCIKILIFQDQVVPKPDYAVWLHPS